VEAFFSINIAWKHYDKYALDPLNEAAEVSYLYKKKGTKRCIQVLQHNR
jgi:hypothetical protein